MPCTDGGAPVTIERLLGFVKDGITQSPTSEVPGARRALPRAPPLRALTCVPPPRRPRGARACWAVARAAAWRGTLRRRGPARGSVAAAPRPPPRAPAPLRLCAATAKTDGAPHAILLVVG